MAQEKLRTLLRKIHVRRNYKDRFFLRCFREKEDLLQLYNAVSGAHYTDPSGLEVTTLEDGIYMSMKNDISFVISWDMCLFEHQSTYNPNMPLRGMFYFSRLYETYVERNKLDIYGSRRLELPVPHFVVFYNGDKDKEDVSILRLSDLYRKDAGRRAYWGNAPRALECTAVMLNINFGHNKELMEACGRLRDYAYFIQLIKDNLSQGMDRRAAVRDAMDRCIDAGVLADLLIKSRGEVYHMILTEFNEKAYKKNLYQDGVKTGMEQGMARGMEQGIALLINARRRQAASYEDTENLLMDVYGIDRETAGQYMEKYWDKQLEAGKIGNI